MKLILAGDLVPTENTRPYFERKDIKTLFGDVPKVFKDADRVIVNLECALTTSEKAIKKFGPNLKAPPVCAEVLAEAGITDCGLSNNHTLDFGEEGLRDTMEHLNRNGIQYTGVGENDTDSRRPHIMEIQGKTISLITVCEHEYTYALPDRMGANPYDPYLTMEDIREAKAKSDYVIVMYHGGKEYCRYPSPRLRRLCQAMAKNGADVVLCQHSHCIGCYEEFDGSHLLYGQGNFHFVGYIDKEGWNEGFIVELDIDDKLNISFIPVTANKNFTGIELAKGSEKERILAGFEERNKHLHSDKWLRGWEKFCESVREQYISAIAKAYVDMNDERSNHHFAHYLDCEAHTDVWRTLCKTWHHERQFS
ncbi:MAG: CapA family protein [Clostridiales bacterium]|nr:CapA family protein [Clostridiales bacterium]